jgi:septal ring factor EnvC (AmiA/AmiB activator)
MLILGIVAVALLSAGCEQVAMKGRSDLRNDPVAGGSYMNDTAVRDPETGSRDALTIANDWADKYAKAAKELIAERDRRHELEQENKTLQAQIAQLKKEMGKYQQELQDANAMMVSMKKDLEQWRTNVLGFRQEMMASQAAILESQRKILIFLGAEEVGDLQVSSSPAKK